MMTVMGSIRWGLHQLLSPGMKRYQYEWNFRLELIQSQHFLSLPADWHPSKNMIAAAQNVILPDCLTSFVWTGESPPFLHFIIVTFILL